MIFRLRVRELAEQKGLSQNRLSRLADVEIKVVRRMFQHPTDSFTTAVLGRIANALEVDIRELFESLPDDQAPPRTSHG